MVKLIKRVKNGAFVPSSPSAFCQTPLVPRAPRISRTFCRDATCVTTQKYCDDWAIPLLRAIIHRSGGGWVWILGSLPNHDGDSNEYSKKAIDLDKQNNNFVRASRFFVRFSAFVARLQRETA